MHKGTLLKMIELGFHYNEGTISVGHSIVAVLGDCNTETIGIGSLDPAFYYPLTGLSFARNHVVALSSPSVGEHCYSMGNLGTAWNCQDSYYPKDPQRPALYM